MLYQREIDASSDVGERERLEAVQRYECSAFDDEIARLESLELLARGGKFYINVDDIALPEGETNHWEMGEHGTWFIRPQSRRALGKKVSDAEYEDRKRKRERLEVWIKFYTAVAATIAAAMGIATFFSKSK